MAIPTPETIPVELQKSTILNTSNAFSRGFDFLTYHWFACLIPLVVLFFHVFLIKKNWEKSKKPFKIVTSTSLVLFLIVLSVTIRDIFIDSLPKAAVLDLALLVNPLCAAIVLGWLIRYAVIKIKNK